MRDIQVNTLHRITNVIISHAIFEYHTCFGIGSSEIRVAGRTSGLSSTTGGGPRFLDFVLTLSLPMISVQQKQREHASVDRAD